MPRESVVDWLERIVYAGVAITAAAQQQATRGRELAFTQWRALNLVGECQDGCRISEVAARVRVTVPATSRLLRRLEKRGLMRLEPDERDGRATRARLTEAGAALRADVLASRREQVALVAETVEDPESAEMVLREVAAEFEARGW
jgi:DNA-binding MarR family transcriptional regulator